MIETDKSVPKPKANVSQAIGTVVCLLDGVDYAGLTGVLGALARESQYRVTLDCVQVPRLGPGEIRTLIRFAKQFAFRGGYLRLQHVNPTVTRLLELFRCLELAVDLDKTPRLSP